jgi:dihydropteroate synthase
VASKSATPDSPHSDAPFRRDRATILGVLNLTPDSFSDGGRFVRGSADSLELAALLGEARAQLEAGAHVLDVGGESTRPGAPPVSAAEEIARTRPAIEALAKALRVPLSIDTRRAAVAEAALDAGACIVNDVSGGTHDPALLGVAARRGARLILGHLRGEPATMQHGIVFADVVVEVGDELAAAIARAEAAGVARERIVADPGIGFGKTGAHNLALLANVGALRARLGVPLLVGVSRKRFLGELTGERQASRRDAASHAAGAIALFAGADAVRVHDVAGARIAAQVALALREARR